MNIAVVNIYPSETVARYLLSGYVLKAYMDRYGEREIKTEVLNFGERVRPLQIVERLAQKKYDLIAYSCYIWNIEKILKTVKNAREQCPDATHVFGGPEISVRRIGSFDPPDVADYYIIGEGERKFLHLAEYIRSRGNDEKENRPLPGGVARWSGGDLVYTQEGEDDNVGELDEIPSVYLSGVIEDRLYERQQVFLETQRGCMFKCRYCVYHKFVSGIKYYSEKRVIDELDHLIREKKVTALRFTDSIFTSDLDRARNIVRHLVKLKGEKNVRLPWIYWEFDYNFVDREFMRLTASLKNREKILNTAELEPADRPQLYSDMLKDYVAINSIGIESFFEDALKGVGRRTVNKERFSRFMRQMNEHNLVLKMDLILGLPFETVDTFYKGLEYIIPFLKGTDHVLNVHRLQILPGSELEDLTGEYRIDYSLKAPHLVYSTNSMSEDEFNTTGKISALLSRSINSPLRAKFFEALEASGKDLRTFLEEMYDHLCSAPELRNITLIRDKMIYDSYWNDMIYRDIPSDHLRGLLENYR